MYNCSSDQYWSEFITQISDYPPLADSMAEAIYFARATLCRDEQPIIDALINAIHPYTFFAQASHHMFWMYLRGILHRDDHPIAIALTDATWPHLRDIPDPVPVQPNQLQEIKTELAAIRTELAQLKLAVRKKRN
jgi:hypothetical protein